MEEIRKTACSICMSYCPIDAHVKDGVLVRVEGGKNTPMQSGGLCAKGAAAKQYLYHPKRLLHPMVRTGPKGSGKFEAVSWETAFSLLTEKMQQVKCNYGAQAMLFYSGYPKWLRPALLRLANGYGSPNFCTQSSTCFQADAMAWRTLFGGGPCYPDLQNTRLVLQWSVNPYHSAPARSAGLLHLKERGVVQITVDPRHTVTAHQADLHLRPIPGTDGALALAMAHVILKEDLYDHSFVERWTHGFEAYQTYAMSFPPERAAEITGVPAEEIKAAARLYATTKPAAIQFSASSLIHTVNGVQNTRAIYALIALTGNYDIPGGNRIHAFPWVPSGIGPGRLERSTPGIGDAAFPIWAQCAQETQCIGLADAIQKGIPYPIRGVFGMGLNHLMWPQSSKMLEALGALDFFVNTELFFTETCQMADLLLPAATSFEREELKCYGAQFYLTQKAVEPSGECRNDIEIIQETARRLGLDDPLLTGSYEAYLTAELAPSGLTLEELRKHPEGLRAKKVCPPTAYSYEKHGFPTPSGKVELCSQILQKLGYEGLPVYRDFRAACGIDAEQYPFILNTGAARPHLFNARLHRLPWLQNLEDADAVELHPEDAASLGIVDGDPVRLVTPTGTLSGSARLNLSAKQGIVGMYHGNAAANINELIPDDIVDPISGFPIYKTWFCRVEKEETP